MHRIKSFTLFVVFLSIISYSYAQTVDEIVAKHIEAIGGYQNWKKIKNIEEKNLLHMTINGNTIEQTSLILDDKCILNSLSFNGEEIIFGIYEEKKGWFKTPLTMGGTGKPENMADSLVIENCKYLDLQDILFDYKEKGFTIELINVAANDTNKTAELRLTHCLGDVTTLIIDLQTFYILKSISNVKVIDKFQEADILFSDFRNIEGLIIPFKKETIGILGGRMIIETQSIKLNLNINEDYFRKPSK